MQGEHENSLERGARTHCTACTGSYSTTVARCACGCAYENKRGTQASPERQRPPIRAVRPDGHHSHCSMRGLTSCQLPQAVAAAAAAQPAWRRTYYNSVARTKPRGGPQNKRRTCSQTHTHTQQQQRPSCRACDPAAMKKARAGTHELPQTPTLRCHVTVACSQCIIISAARHHATPAAAAIHLLCAHSGSHAVRAMPLACEVRGQGAAALPPPAATVCQAPGVAGSKQSLHPQSCSADEAAPRLGWFGVCLCFLCRGNKQTAQDTAHTRGRR
jgi:hypothetical protein